MKKFSELLKKFFSRLSRNQEQESQDIKTARETGELLRKIIEVINKIIDAPAAVASPAAVVAAVEPTSPTASRGAGVSSATSSPASPAVVAAAVAPTSTTSAAAPAAAPTSAASEEIEKKQIIHCLTKLLELKDNSRNKFQLYITKEPEATKVLNTVNSLKAKGADVAMEREYKRSEILKEIKHNSNALSTSNEIKEYFNKKYKDRILILLQVNHSNQGNGRPNTLWILENDGSVKKGSGVINRSHFESQNSSSAITFEAKNQQHIKDILNILNEEEEKNTHKTEIASAEELLITISKITSNNSEENITPTTYDKESIVNILDNDQHISSAVPSDLIELLKKITIPTSGPAAGSVTLENEVAISNDFKVIINYKKQMLEINSIAELFNQQDNEYSIRTPPPNPSSSENELVFVSRDPNSPTRGFLTPDNKLALISLHPLYTKLEYTAHQSNNSSYLSPMLPRELSESFAEVADDKKAKTAQPLTGAATRAATGAPTRAPAPLANRAFRTMSLGCLKDGIRRQFDSNTVTNHALRSEEMKQCLA